MPSTLILGLGAAWVLELLPTVWWRISAWISIWPNGIIFHQPRETPEIRGFPLLNHHLGFLVVWGRYDLTRSMSLTSKNTTKAKWSHHLLLGVTLVITFTESTPVTSNLFWNLKTNQPIEPFQKNSPKNVIRLEKNDQTISTLWFDLRSPKKLPVFPSTKLKKAIQKNRLPQPIPTSDAFLRIFPSHLRESVFTGTRPAVKTVSRGDWSFFSVECSDPGYP